MSSTKAVVGALAVAGTVYAAQAEYQQCGGIGWTGGTTCASPWVCTALNNYYSQCLPGSSSATTTKASTTTTTTKSTTVSTSSKTTTTVGTTSSKPTTSSSSTSSSSTKVSTTSSSTSAGPTASVVPGNPFTKPGLAHTYYANEVSTAVAAFQSKGDTVNAAKAASVASIPTFYWLDTAAKVPTMASILAAAGSTKLAQFVVYDFPDRDCAAASSAGEFSSANGGQALYFAYIDAIAAQIKAYPNVQVAIVYEPDGLPNLVTNLNIQKCANAESTYIACAEYGLKTLNLPNVSIYVDAGHAGWLGYTSNAGPAATLFAQVYKAAGSPAAVRGLATNVANYNAFDNGGNPDPITVGSYDPAADEMQYQAEMVPLLQKAGFPSQFITDTGRNGQQNLRAAWGDWCNVKGAGFGIRPTTNTGTSYTDAFVWVKPGGECDGSSNSSAPRYDPHCGLSDADQPAPQAGTWFEEYFETLVKQANPPL